MIFFLKEREIKEITNILQMKERKKEHEPPKFVAWWGR